MKSEVLKKHHFWILLGLVPLFVLIGVFAVSSSVGGAIEDREKAIKKSQDILTGKTAPKPEPLLKKLDKQIDTVNAKQGGLWKENWDRQKGLYVWPGNSPLLKQVERLNLRFGDRIPNDRDQYEEFKKPEVYLAEYSTAGLKAGVPPGYQGMVDKIAPTQFRDGWQKTIRHVNQWPDAVLTSEQIWLLLEDMWVQRSMLDAVRAVNTDLAEFRRVKFEKDGTVIDDPTPGAPEKDPLRRKFKSRIWEVELEVGKKDNKQVLTGRLINHTERLQLMGVGNTMVLKVWLEPGTSAQPFEFKIGGEFLPGAGALKADGKTPANVLNIVTTPDHTIPPGTNATEIVRVEQVFDVRTVPIRRIEDMALGQLDSRNAASVLEMPRFPAFDKEKEAAAASAAAGMGDAGTPRPLPIGGGDAGAGAGARPSGGGTVQAVVNDNKKRYLKATPNVRRMPVAMSVVVDQTYLQDVLLAFANSPLRFQTTQVTWSRFRGTLNTGSAGDAGTPVVPSGPVVSSPLFGEGFGPRPVGPITPAVTPGLPGTGFGVPNTVSDSQLTSGLIELKVYGVVSLYEKYSSSEPVTEVKEKAPKDSPPKEPLPKEPMPREPPAPKELPMPKEPPAGKTRVRRGRR